MRPKGSTSLVAKRRIHLAKQVKAFGREMSRQQYIDVMLELGYVPATKKVRGHAQHRLTNVDSNDFVQVSYHEYCYALWVTDRDWEDSETLPLEG